MSITTKIIAPIWLLGLAMAGFAIFIELATLGPAFGALAVRSTNTVTRAVDAAVASTDTPEELERALSVLAQDPSVRLLVVAGGEPLRVLATTRGEYRNRPDAALPPALRDQLLTASATKKQASWTDEASDTFGLASPPQGAALLGAADRASIVVVDHRPITAAVRDLIWMGIRRKLVLIMSVSMVALFALRAFVFRPVKRIRTAIERLRSGDAAARVLVVTRDEMGELSAIINDALDARNE